MNASPSLTERAIAEAFGTFALVFVGTGAIVVNDAGAALGALGVAVAFGLVIAVMVVAFGDVSGAHFNPAVSVGFWAARVLPARELPHYVGAQCAGAIAGSLAVRVLLGPHGTLGATLPAGSWPQSFACEVIFTSFLMIVILGVVLGVRERGAGAGLAIGATVALAALVGGPISGASLNPARSLGPALVGGAFAHLWLYFTAPTLGALAAVGVCRAARGNDCCRG